MANKIRTQSFDIKTQILLVHLRTFNTINDYTLTFNFSTKAIEVCTYTEACHAVSLQTAKPMSNIL